MLEELDLLAKRVQKLVTQVRTLTEESAGLRQKLDQLQLERDELVAKAQSESEQVGALKASLGTAENEAAQTRKKAQEDRATLQGTLDLFRQENQGIQALSLSGSEFSPGNEYLPNVSYQRALTVKFTYTFSTVVELTTYSEIDAAIFPTVVGDHGSFERIEFELTL